MSLIVGVGSGLIAVLIKNTAHNLGDFLKDFSLETKEPQNFINLILPSIEQVMVDMNWEKQKQKIRISNMWAIINTGGSANTRHQHGNSTISGAYYVRAPKNSGDIVFYDPRQSRLVRKPKISKLNNLNGEEVNIKPTDGLLVLFPSYLYHSVNENLSNEERIVISFNVDLK